MWRFTALTFREQGFDVVDQFFRGVVRRIAAHDAAVTVTQGATTQAERTRELATDLSGLVGVQVSPLLVLAVSGAWAIYEAERNEHPETRWYARRSFVLALLLLMSALFLAVGLLAWLWLHKRWPEIGDPRRQAPESGQRPG